MSEPLDLDAIETRLHRIRHGGAWDEDVAIDDDIAVLIAEVRRLRAENEELRRNPDRVLKFDHTEMDNIRFRAALTEIAMYPALPPDSSMPITLRQDRTMRDIAREALGDNR